MIKALMAPDTGEFLGLAITVDELDGSNITIFGAAAVWQAIARGENVDPTAAGIIRTTDSGTMLADVPTDIERLAVDGLKDADPL